MATIPQYSGKDQLVFMTIVLPYTLCMNFIIFGTQYISSLFYFFVISAVTVIVFTIFFTGMGSLAVFMKKRFFKEEQVGVRLGTIIAFALLLSALFLWLLFRFYEAIPYFRFKSSDETFVWSFFALSISNIFLSFLHEGISRYQVWEQNRDETEQLKTIYQRSRLQGLRSQVNPHFLFNSLNSLSSLIMEDEDKAEKFLDEMSKVYRYLLRNESDTLVRLEEELKFLESYHHLLNARYGSGLQIKVDVTNEYKTKWLPPLALQTIIENAFTQNTISKTTPLVVSITAETDELIVSNNIQLKIITDNADVEMGLDNLFSKYNLLTEKGAIIEETLTERTIRLPLINEQKEAVG